MQGDWLRSRRAVTGQIRAADRTSASAASRLPTGLTAPPPKAAIAVPTGVNRRTQLFAPIRTDPLPPDRAPMIWQVQAAGRRHNGEARPGAGCGCFHLNHALPMETGCRPDASCGSRTTNRRKGSPISRLNLVMRAPGSCVDGPRPARVFSRAGLCGHVRSCVRPVGAAECRRGIKPGCRLRSTSTTFLVSHSKSWMAGRSLSSGAPSARPVSRHDGRGHVRESVVPPLGITRLAAVIRPPQG